MDQQLEFEVDCRGRAAGLLLSGQQALSNRFTCYARRDGPIESVQFLTSSSYEDFDENALVAFVALALAAASAAPLLAHHSFALNRCSQAGDPQGLCNEDRMD
jgi:hypothetical protein